MRQEPNVTTLLDSKCVAKIVKQKDDKWDQGSIRILLNDKKTIIVLEKQNYHDYHDCDSDARTIGVYQDRDDWKRYFSNEEYFVDADKL